MCHRYGMFCKQEAYDATSADDDNHYFGGGRRLADDFEGRIDREEGDDVDINEEEDGGRLL